MGKKLIGVFVLFVSIFMISTFGYAAPTEVRLQGNQLITKKSGGKATPYIIKGITWQPATRAPATGLNPSYPLQTIKYGYFDSAPVSAEYPIFSYWLKGEFSKYYKKDIALMRQANINTVRVYTDLGTDPQVYNAILDEFNRNGIMVIVTFSKLDILNGSYMKIVSLYRTHPAILMWCLGNEWNIEYFNTGVDNSPYGLYPFMSVPVPLQTKDVANLAGAIDSAAKAIKNADPFHPVSSALGYRPVIAGELKTQCYPFGRGGCSIGSDPTEIRPAITDLKKYVVLCPNIDIWGLSVYRGNTFGDLFTQWPNISSKPFYVSDFGVDSYHITSIVYVGPDPTSVVGNKDEFKQWDALLRLGNELQRQLSPKGRCLGGFVREFNDEIWKVGNNCYGLAGFRRAPYDNNSHNYDSYDTGGYQFGLSADTDSINSPNEEYYGIVDANRTPKQAYYGLQRIYASFDNSK
ncbi:MAG: hypothetical protein NTU54_06635 [Candidatus Omnitrophica bacterium]|nr:hypothetical protein [Candidatus Omnitrophota bacterium]